MIRVWVTVTPAGKNALQAAYDAAGLGGEIASESWTAYPPGDPAQAILLWVGANWDDAVAQQIEAVSNANASVSRHWRGPLTPRGAALTYEQAQAQFPAANSGPVPETLVTKKAAQWMTARDFGLAWTDDGSPGAAPASPAAENQAGPK